MMAKIDPKDVQRLREESGAGVMDCKRALEKAAGDFAKAKAILEQQGFERHATKSDRATGQGIVEAYVHAGGLRGALVELQSETDFVARSPEFKQLAKELAMQVAGMGTEDVDELLGQDYIRDPSKRVRDLVTTLGAKTGENIRVGRVAFFRVGAR